MERPKKVQKVDHGDSNGLNVEATGSERNIRFSIDRGGTFTDIYAETRDGHYTLKLLSVDPQK